MWLVYNCGKLGQIWATKPLSSPLQHLAETAPPYFLRFTTTSRRRALYEHRAQTHYYINGRLQGCCNGQLYRLYITACVHTGQGCIARQVVTRRQGNVAAHVDWPRTAVRLRQRGQMFSGPSVRPSVMLIQYLPSATAWCRNDARRRGRGTSSRGRLIVKTYDLLRLDTLILCW